MAKINVMAKVFGRPASAHEIEEGSTVGGLKATLGLPNYTATINASPASDSEVLSDGDYVNLTESIKGGC